jgi:GR25 family glycosyltransferase involved in LPS biosynthesis
MYLDKIYVINLRSAPDRLAHMKQQLDNVKIPEYMVEYMIVDRPTVQEIKPSFLPDVDPLLRTGKYGCYTSHLKILRDIKKNNYKYALVLEDDINILNKDIIGLVDKYISQLIDSDINFDVLYLGGLCKSRSPKKISDNVYKTLLMNGSFAYVVSQNAMNLLPVIENLDIEIDMGFRQCSKKGHEFYAVVPPIIEQSETIISTISGNKINNYHSHSMYSYKVLTGLTELPEHKL